MGGLERGRGYGARVRFGKGGCWTADGESLRGDGDGKGGGEGGGNRVRWEGVYLVGWWAG